MDNGDSTCNSNYTFSSSSGCLSSSTTSTSSSTDWRPRVYTPLPHVHVPVATISTTRCASQR
ncbi:hypothetical protein QC762_105306 [Podospora pseudocomata]|uniref:Uncharacterized protein n=3 Tax=Podospora TaxID=5144 RepID=A0ABY6RUH1_PODCO|nr:hypothetical protein QC761_105306 [Podospora bellae-mahoneyi]KAK4658864.1 hypothetical protein QC762_105306 [Podospora pseudocomata]VBB71903.1 Putative protein of unknown function [Podospora comata]